MPRLPEADLRATMTQEAHLQQVRELILADPRVRFVNHVADLTNTRLGASTSDLAAAVGLTLDRPGGGALLAPGASQAPSPVQVALGRTPSQRLGASTPARSIAGSEGAASISRAASIFGGAGGAGQPAMLQRTQKISEMEPIDMATLGISDDELRALGESALRSEQLRSAAAYVKRPEATGLILIDTKINSHAETVFNELRALRNSPLRLQSDMLTLVYSEDLWRLFAEAVAARINMTNGGLAPQRDVLQAQFKRVSAHYASLYTELANDIGYDTQGRIVSRKLQRRRNGGGGGGSSWGGGGGGGGSGSWELGGGSRGGGGGAAPSFGSQAEMHDWLYQAPPLPRSSLGPSFAR